MITPAVDLTVLAIKAIIGSGSVCIKERDDLEVEAGSKFYNPWNCPQKHAEIIILIVNFTQKRSNLLYFFVSKMIIKFNV